MRGVPSLERLVRYPLLVVGVTIVLTGAAVWVAPRVGFDYNLLNLQGDDAESVVWEKKSLAAAGRSGFAALATATSPAELEAKHAAFARLSSVADVQSALSVMPDRQAERLAIIARMAPVVEDVRIGTPPP